MQGGRGGLRGGGKRYAVLDDILAARVVVDVDGDAAQGGDFGGELGEAGLVLSGGGERGGGSVRFLWGGAEGPGPGRGPVLFAGVGFGHGVLGEGKDVGGRGWFAIGRD